MRLSAELTAGPVGGGYQQSKQAAPVPSPAAATDTAVLQPVQISTENYPSAQQFDAWAAHGRLVFDLTPASTPTFGFSANRQTWRLGSLLVVHDQLGAHLFERNAAHIRLEPIDHWYFVVQRCGVSETACEKRVARCQPGALALRSLARPVSGTKSDLGHSVVFSPTRHVLGTGVVARCKQQHRAGEAAGHVSRRLFPVRVPPVGLPSSQGCASAAAILDTDERQFYKILDDHGFANPNHFSRLFRDEFGFSPSEVREQAANRNAPTEIPLSFGNLLRNL